MVQNVNKLKFLLLQNLPLLSLGMSTLEVLSSIEFNHEASTGRSLNANTCAIQLVFPVNERYCSSLDSFAENIGEDILNGPTFGMV